MALRTARICAKRASSESLDSGAEAEIGGDDVGLCFKGGIFEVLAVPVSEGKDCRVLIPFGCGSSLWRFRLVRGITGVSGSMPRDLSSK